MGEDSLIYRDDRVKASSVADSKINALKFYCFLEDNTVSELSMVAFLEESVAKDEELYNNELEYATKGRQLHRLELLRQKMHARNCIE